MKAQTAKALPLRDRQLDGRILPGDVSNVITPAGRYDLVSAEKLRGGYYTPGDLADWLAEWAVTSETDRVCEPSCGDGNFLVAIANRLRSLGATKASVARQLKGIELNPGEAARARARVGELVGPRSNSVVETTDFFEWCSREKRTHPSDRFDAIIGNPPFIRYQNFPEPARTLAMSLMCDSGLKPNKLTNMWVPFVVGAANLVREGGRLAMVIPAELLQVTYAAQLRRFLTCKFDSIEIVSCNQLFFDGAEQEVLLLLASGARPHVTDSKPAAVKFVSKETVEEITQSDPQYITHGVEEKWVCNDSEKWLKYFLSSIEIEFMRELRMSETCLPLSEFADVDVGVVTGKNEFFVVNRECVELRGLEDICRQAVGRSAHLSGAIFRKSDWTELDRNNQRVHLINYAEKPVAKLSRSERAYITYGEVSGFQQGFKCRTRKPWFQVPGLWIPNGLVFRQIYDFPRVVLNSACAVPTDTIHRLRVHGCGTEEFIQSTYTFLTGASAEIEGRSYGGGVLELEPTEAERMLVPARQSSGLSLEEIDPMIRGGQIAVVLEENSRRILHDGLGLSQMDIDRLKEIWLKMKNRRNARRLRR